VRTTVVNADKFSFVSLLRQGAVRGGRIVTQRSVTRGFDSQPATLQATYSTSASVSFRIGTARRSMSLEELMKSVAICGNITLTCVPVESRKRCLTSSIPVRWQSWLVACPSYTLQIMMLLHGWPTMVPIQDALDDNSNIITHRRSVAKRDGCFQRRMFVCLSVCLSVSLSARNNFRTIKRTMMKLGD